MLLKEIKLKEIKIDAVDYFEVSLVERNDEKMWQVIVWAKPPVPLNLAAIFKDMDNCPSEIKKYFKNVVSIEKTDFDGEDLEDEDKTLITPEDEGLMFMYPASSFDSDEALRNAKMVMDRYVKFGKDYVSKAE